MTKKAFRLSRIPQAAIAALCACLFGYLYCFSFRSLLDAQHWYAFSAPLSLTLEDFSTSVTFIAIAMFVYYTMFLIAAVLLILPSRRYLMHTLLIAAAARLTALVLMFRPGFTMVFQFGFEALMEIAALVCTAFLCRHVRRKRKKLYESRVTVCVLAVLAEAVPLLRNIQYLFLSDLTLGAKLGAIMLPVCTAAFFSLLAFRMDAGRRFPVRVSDDVAEDADELVPVPVSADAAAYAAELELIEEDEDAGEDIKEASDHQENDQTEETEFR